MSQLSSRSVVVLRLAAIASLGACAVEVVRPAAAPPPPAQAATPAAPPPGPAPPAAPAALQHVSLQSLNFPDQYMRHCSGLGFIDNNLKGNGACNPAVYRQDVTFSIVPGLAGGTSISIESVNYPGSFLRHQNGRIKLAKNDGSPLFKLDASFDRVAGLGGRETSFRSVNFPDHYIRHCSGKLYIDRNDGSNKDCDPSDAVYRSDATFKLVAGLF
jgi:hypothetical protein